MNIIDRLKLLLRVRVLVKLNANTKGAFWESAGRLEPRQWGWITDAERENLYPDPTGELLLKNDAALNGRRFSLTFADHRVYFEKLN